jgi:hypothetical protein
MKPLIIPATARIAWNTLDDTIMIRESQESIFLATFDDIVTNFEHRHQIDYSFYDRGSYEGNPKFILEVYTFGELDNEASDTVYHFKKEYEGLHDAIDDINYWLDYFKDKNRINMDEKAIQKIILSPQVGMNIEGLGQINFGDSREQVLTLLGEPSFVCSEKRLEFKDYGCFIDFRTSDNTLEAVEFWNDGKNNVAEVFMYDTEVLQNEATPIKAILQERNNNEPHKDGWFLNIDVIFSGGSQETMLNYIEEMKKEGQYEGVAKEQALIDLEKAKYFSSFGIGYKGYCRDGLAELERILNG